MVSTARHDKELKEKVNAQLRTCTDPVEIIKLKCLQRGAAGIKNIGVRFRIMDDDKSEKISMPEFKKGIAELGCHFSAGELKSAFEAFDSDKSGSIDYNEFLMKLQESYYNEKRKAIVEKAFQKLDKDNSGKITIDDLKDVFDVSCHPKYISGEMTKEQILTQFLYNFDSPSNKDGIVTREEFFSYYAGISASIDSDAYFALTMEKAWRLNERPKTSNSKGYKPKDLMESLGHKTSRKDFSRGGTDLQCSLKVGQDKLGVYHRDI